MATFNKHPAPQEFAWTPQWKHWLSRKFQDLSNFFADPEFPSATVGTLIVEDDALVEGNLQVEEDLSAHDAAFSGEVTVGENLYIGGEAHISAGVIDIPTGRFEGPETSSVPGSPSSPDLNSITQNGWYRFDSTTSNTPTANGICLHMARTSAIWAQLALARESGPAAWIRQKNNAGTVSSWTELTTEDMAHTITGSWTWTTASAGVAPITITSTEAGASSGPLLDLLRDSASPAAADNLGAIRFRGKDSNGNLVSYNQFINVILDPTDGSEDSDWRVQTMNAGTLATRLIVGQGVQIGSPTGGDQGAGTLNATAVYDDGVLLTDYVPDAAVDGDFDLSKYNKEDRPHRPAEEFKNNLNELDPEEYARKWRNNRRLPAFSRGPEKKSLGQAIQALLETCEVQAVHIDKLHQRIKELEKK